MGKCPEHAAERAPVRETRAAATAPPPVAVERRSAPPAPRPPSRDDRPFAEPPPEIVAEPRDRHCPYNAVEYLVTHPAESSFHCQCSGAAAEEGSIWGSGLYTGDSAICRAAKHAGYWRADGDEVRVYVREGQAHYDGTEAYGVQSQSFGQFETSFSFN